MPKRKPCTDCGEQPKKKGHRLWCEECWLRRQSPDIRTYAAARRLAAVPESLRRDSVPLEVVPRGRRWCRGCQTFVLFEDIATGAIRCITCTSARTHASHAARTYGEDTDYMRMLKRQSGVCAGCGNRPKKKRLAIDHNHATGKRRGLLCDRCNHDILGNVESLGRVRGPAVLRALADYLEADGWSGKPLGFARPLSGLEQSRRLTPEQVSASLEADPAPF